jgi:hypothetical protein
LPARCAAHRGRVVARDGAAAGEELHHGAQAQVGKPFQRLPAEKKCVRKLPVPLGE